MQITTILGHEFTTIGSLKDFASKHNILPEGNKSLKVTWVSAIENYLTMQSQVIEIATEADTIAQDGSQMVETVSLAIGSLVVAALSSAAAIKLYRGSIKFIMFALVFTWMIISASAKWAWIHRRDTAVYHWINDELNSEQFKEIVSYRDKIVQNLNDRASNALVRLGLAGMEIH